MVSRVAVLYGEGGSRYTYAACFGLVHTETAHASWSAHGLGGTHGSVHPMDDTLYVGRGSKLRIGLRAQIPLDAHPDETRAARKTCPLLGRIQPKWTYPMTLSVHPMDDTLYVGRGSKLRIGLRAQIPLDAHLDETRAARKTCPLLGRIQHRLTHLMTRPIHPMNRRALVPPRVAFCVGYVEPVEKGVMRKHIRSSVLVHRVVVRASWGDGGRVAGRVYVGETGFQCVHKLCGLARRTYGAPEGRRLRAVLGLSPSTPTPPALTLTFHIERSSVHPGRRPSSRRRGCGAPP
jgi:hypothetical protein